MVGNLDKWPSKRGPISKIRPSDGCGRDAVPLAVERWYDFPEFGCHLGNVGIDEAQDFLEQASRHCHLGHLQRDVVPLANDLHPATRPRSSVKG